MLKPISYLLCTAMPLLFFSCSSSKPTAWVIFNNQNSEGKPVEMTLVCKNEKGGNSLLTKQVIRPGLQSFPGFSIKKGKYEFAVTANNNLVGCSKVIMVDSDRWIFVSYIQSDSVKLNKSYGYWDLTAFTKINHEYAGLDMFFQSRKPANLN
jgi:hypothetical protein